MNNLEECVTKYGSSIRSELTADFKSIFMPPEFTNGPNEVSKSFILDMSFKEGEKEPTNSPYLVHHLMYKSSGKDLLDSWARSKKLFPWVAVGAPLKVNLPVLSSSITSAHPDPGRSHLLTSHSMDVFFRF